MKRFTGLMLLAMACLFVAACGGSSSSKSSSSPSSTTVGGKLVIDNASGSTWTCQFSPFNAAVTLTSFGFFYEPLQQVDILNNAHTTPWLATSSQWSNHFKTLTVTTRSGVTCR